eukprot:2223591-Karenia_brevis.AAC.1
MQDIRLTMQFKICELDLPFVTTPNVPWLSTAWRKRVRRWCEERVRHLIMESTLLVSSSVMCPWRCQRHASTLHQIQHSGLMGFRGHES